MNWTDWTDCWVRKHTHTPTGHGIFARQRIHRGQPIFRVIPSLGTGLYPIHTVNHSCIPTMFALSGHDPSTHLPEIRFYAIREIAMGEELTRCYADAGLLAEPDVRLRRAWMREWAGFECLCLRCVGESSSSSGKWYCPEHWLVDYAMGDRELSEYLNGLVHVWKVEDERMRLSVRDKTRILAQRTVFSLRCFRDDVKGAAEKVKRHTSESTYRLKLESKILHSYVKRRKLLGESASEEWLFVRDYA